MQLYCAGTCLVTQFVISMLYSADLQFLKIGTVLFPSPPAVKHYVTQCNAALSQHEYEGVSRQFSNSFLC